MDEISKIWSDDLLGRREEAADALLKQACEKLLANTVVESYAVEHG